MRTVGIITEYNPFHNGHAYHIEQSKIQSGADYCVVVMSGDFVQRGTPAIIDKFSRAEMALRCGADLVLELPAVYACGSAEYFALGAVALLHSLGIVDTLCFGSECGDISLLAKVADILFQEPADYRCILRDYLSQGDGFPAARQKAIKNYLLEICPDDQSQSTILASLLEDPNNILGIEYLKALRTLGSSIRPLTIQRKGGSYHQDFLDGTFSSATSIRKILYAPSQLLKSMQRPADLLTPLKSEIPGDAFPVLEKAFGRSCPVTASDFSAMLHYRLLMVSSCEELTQFLDISADLAKRIYAHIPYFRDLDSFVAIIKTRQYTEGRIRRCLLHLLLGIRTDLVNSLKSSGCHRYLRVLGIRKESSPLLRQIKECCSLPLITKLADAHALLDSKGQAMLESDLFASQVYHSAVTSKYNREPYNEFTVKFPVI